MPVRDEGFVAVAPVGADTDRSHVPAPILGPLA
jgi:hypothetical protein